VAENLPHDPDVHTLLDEEDHSRYRMIASVVIRPIPNARGAWAKEWERRRDALQAEAAELGLTVSRGSGPY
jgi:hypothetical protein